VEDGNDDADAADAGAVTVSSCMLVLALLAKCDGHNSSLCKSLLSANCLAS